MYPWHCFTINSSGSECDHRCETRNAEPDIETNRSSQTCRNPRVDRYGPGFRPPRVSESGFWTGLELNRPVVLSKFGLLAGYPDLLVTLLSPPVHSAHFGI
jgi:hypothetical protein